MSGTPSGAPRARRPRSATVPLARATRLLLEQCAAAAGTVAEEHATALILRDAQARGLLRGEGARAVATRPSVITPLTPDWELELAAYPPPALC